MGSKIGETVFLLSKIGSKTWATVTITIDT